MQTIGNKIACNIQYWTYMALRLFILDLVSTFSKTIRAVSSTVLYCTRSGCLEQRCRSGRTRPDRSIVATAGIRLRYYAFRRTTEGWLCGTQLGRNEGRDKCSLMMARATELLFLCLFFTAMLVFAPPTRFFRGIIIRFLSCRIL